MENPLGRLIADEVSRAEADFNALRVRGQGVLTVSGALVTALAGLLAIAVGKDQHLDLATMTTLAAVGALLSFLGATAIVLIMFLPSKVDVPEVADLTSHAEGEWDAEGLDQQVALLMTKYLTSLRLANAGLAKKLAWSIALQVGGILCVGLMALSLLEAA